MKAAWSKRRGRVAPNNAPESDRTTLARSDADGASPIALYVTGPHGGTRHLLRPEALVRLGRAAESTIVVDDPRVSRAHAVLQPAPPFAVSDLGSANGTFVGRERLRVGEARTLALGETFFVGDSALVLRESGLGPPPAQRVLTLEQVTEGFGPAPSLPHSPDDPEIHGAAILKVRPSRPSESRWVEAILADLLTASTDWIARLHGGETAIGLRAASIANAAASERAALERLASWSITATIESTFLSTVDAAVAREALLRFFRGGGVVRLQRGEIIVRDPSMQALKQTLERIAAAPVSLLVLGETGVGKDVVASMVHELSPRARKPFVRLNCASLPEGLLESELFGHERGAFTGAVEAKTGLLEAADGGTVFLDEIGDLALPLQAKLLRAIESCEITRVGGVRPRRIDVRFVAATNSDLVADMKEKKFRPDLYHRLNGVTVTVPPLRDRRVEIEPLARHFLADACARFGIARAELSLASIAALHAHPWPGNVRELRNVVERAVLLASGIVLEPHHLGLAPAEGGGDQESGRDAVVREVGEPVGTVPIASGIARSERLFIEDALVKVGGNQSRAADLLGIPRRTLVRKIKQLGLPRPRKRGA
jgi:two-component system, NtrC family, response regulator AtoC